MEQLLNEDKRVCLRCRSPLTFRISRFGCLFACRCHAEVVDGQKVVNAYYDRVRDRLGPSPLLPFLPVIELGAFRTDDIASMRIVSVEVSCMQRKAVALLRNFRCEEAHSLLDSLSNALREQVEFVRPLADLVVSTAAYDCRTTVGFQLPLEVMDHFLSELDAAASAPDTGFLLSLPPPQIQEFLDTSLRTEAESNVPDAASIASRVPAALGKVLRSHQLEAVRTGLCWNGRILIADEMGTGKTLAALGIVAATRSYPLLIVTPSALKFMWVEEIEKYLFEQVGLDDIHIINGSNDALAADARETPKVVITSFHMAATLHQQLLARKWKGLVVDESHTLHTNAGPTDARYTELLVRIGKSSEHCVLLSGTPALTSPFDMFNQVDMLRPGLLGETRWHFALRYCRVRMAPYLQLLECTRAVEFGSLLRSLCMVRRLKHEVLELPAKSRIVLRVASNADREDGKLGSNSFQHRYSQCWKRKQRGIFEAVTYACDKYPTVVLFAHHLALLDELASFLTSRKITFIRIDGGVEPQLRGPLLSRFEHGEVKVAVVGITACAVGISLASAHCAVFCELPPDAAWMLQAEDRLHRYGQTSEISVYYLVGVNSSFDAKHFAELCESFSRVRDVTDGNGEVLSFGHTSRHSPHARMLAETRKRAHSGEARLSVQGGTEAPPHTDALVFRISKSTRRIHAKTEGHHGGNYHPSACFYCSFSWEEASACVRERASPVWKQLSGYMQAVERLSPFQQRLLILSGKWHPSDFSWTEPSMGRLISGKRNRYRQENESLLPGGVPARGNYGWGFWWKVTRQGLPTHFYFASLSPASASGSAAAQSPYVPCCLGCGKALPSGALADVHPHPGMVVEIAGDATMFCRGTCREAFFVKRSSGAIRSSVRRADRGVCASCHVDCERLCAEASAAASKSAREALVCQQLPHLKDFPTLFRTFVDSPTPGNLWHADHIVPVAMGGGEATLENVQTLCIACHALKTQEDLKAIGKRNAGSAADCDASAGGCSTVAVAQLRMVSGTQTHRATRRP